jgi:hypothetical protein
MQVLEDQQQRLVLALPQQQLPSFSPKEAGVDLGAGGEPWLGARHPAD